MPAADQQPRCPKDRRSGEPPPRRSRHSRTCFSPTASAQNTPWKPHDIDRADRADRGARGGDGDKAGDPRRGTEGGRVPVTKALGEQPAQSGSTGRLHGVDPTEAVLFAATAEPALKPNQPNHSRPAPIITRVRLCGRIGSMPPAEAACPGCRCQRGPAAPGVDVPGCRRRV